MSYLQGYGFVEFSKKKKKHREDDRGEGIHEGRK
jgi:hypothetical protein